MASNIDDDLAPTRTEGFKLGEKKTVEEYAKLGTSFHVLIKAIIATLTTQELLRCSVLSFPFEISFFDIAVPP